MHHDAKIDRLKQISLFRDANKQSLQHLASAADEISLRAGQQIIVQGHMHHEAYVIVSGSVEVEIEGNKVATVTAGQLVGELGFFGHWPATATVTALEPVEALSIPYNRFDQILDDNPQLTKSLAKELARRLFRMNAEYADHAHE